MRNLLVELKRRNVFRVATLYVVVGWLLLQIADVLFPIFMIPDWAFRWTAVLLMLGFIPAVAFSWAYELTPEGIKREEDVDRTQSITPHTGKRIDRLIIVALVAVIGLLLIDRFYAAPEAPSPEPVQAEAAAPPDEPVEESVALPATEPDSGPSIAVLPFVNMSPDPDNAFFADGLSDTLMHVLSQVKDLKVAARTSSFTFRDKDATVQQIGNELGVKTVLEGSVQKAGDRLRIIAQLIDVSDGAHLWSQNFDRTADDVFAIQDEIATEVVDALKVTLLGAERERISRAQTVNLDAYREYVLGVQEAEKRQSEALDRAEAHFQKAIEIDPEYVLAYVGLGETYQLLAEYSDLSNQASIEMVGQVVEQALALDSLSAEAITLKASWLADKNQDEEAEQAYLQALELNPNHARAYHWYTLLLRNQRRFEEALVAIRKAQQLDPLSDVIQLNVATTLWAMERHELAVQHVKDQIERNPDFPGYYGLMTGFARFGWGDLAEALYWHNEQLKRDPGNINNRDLLCDLYMELGRMEKADACIRDVEEIAGDRLDPMFTRAVWHVLRGEREKATRIVDAIRERAPDHRGGSGFRSQLYALEGRFEEALAMYREANPEFFEPDAELDRSNYANALYAAFLLSRTGAQEQSENLLKQAETIMAGMSRNRGFGYFWSDIVVHSIRGDRDKAVLALEEAIEMNLRPNWYTLKIAPVFGPLREDERFPELIARLESDIAAQAARAEADGLL